MLKGIMTGIIVFFMIAIVFYAYEVSVSRTPPSKILNTTIVAFDYDGRHKFVTEDRVKQGDAVIFLEVISPDKAYYFNSLNELRQFDDNKDGFIDMNNEGYQRLFVGRYNKNGKLIEYLPFRLSGISGIKLNLINGQVESAIAILADSSRRMVDVLAISDGFLQSASLKSNEKLQVISLGYKRF